MKKRLLSLVLCLVMVFSLFPAFGMSAAAADGYDHELDINQGTSITIKSGETLKLIGTGSDSRNHNWSSSNTNVLSVTAITTTTRYYTAAATSYSVDNATTVTITHTYGLASTTTERFYVTVEPESSSGGDDPTPGTGGYQIAYNGLQVGDQIDMSRQYYIKDGNEYKPVQITNAQYFTEQNQDWTVQTGVGKYYLPADESTGDPDSFRLVSNGTGDLYTPHSDLKYRTVVNGDYVKSLTWYYGIPTDYYYLADGTFYKVYGEYQGRTARFYGKLYRYIGPDGEESTAEYIATRGNSGDDPAEWTAVKNNYLEIETSSAFIWGGNPSVGATLYTKSQGANSLIYDGTQIPGSSVLTVNDPTQVLYTGPLYDKSTDYGATKIVYTNGDTIGEDYKEGTVLTNQPLYWFDPTGQSGTVEPNHYDSDPDLGILLDENTNFDGNLFLKKGLYFDQESGTYGIKLESWATGNVSQHQEVAVTPTDIILVLDHSGSMADPLASSKSITVEQIAASVSTSQRHRYATGDNYSAADYSGATYLNRSAYVDSDSGQYIYCYDNHDGTYDLKIGPYSNSKFVKINKVDADNVQPSQMVPVKTVNRADALRAAVSEFIESLAEITDESGTPVHRIAMVGFGGYKQSNGNMSYHWTGIYDGGEQGRITPYADREDHYATAFKGLDASGKQELHNYAVMYDTQSVNYEGSKTFVNYGLEMAQGIIQARNTEHPEDADRPVTVILFSDGMPGQENGKDGYTVANAALPYAKNIKDLGATIYSIGLLDNPSQNLDGPNPYSVSYTVEDFLKVASTAWPNADELGDVSRPIPDTDYCIITNGSNIKLSDAFKATVKTVTESETDVPVNGASVLKDVINKNNLSIGLGTDSPAKMKATVVTADQIDAYKNIHWTETNKNGKTVEDEHVLNDNDADAWADTAWSIVTDETVSVSGFDYTGRFTAYDAGGAHDYGDKLIVRIKGLTPETGGEALLSNTEAGIYTKAGDDDPFLSVDSPDYTIPTKTMVIDFNAPMNLSPVAGQLKKQTNNNGSFELDENTHTLTYQLGYKSGEKISKGADISLSGTDSALAYVVRSFDSTMTVSAKGAELKQDSGWTDFIAVPASSVYFDDELLEAQAVDIGTGSSYNSEINTGAAASIGAAEQGGNIQITFTGSRIDAYCTTTAEGKSVTANLKDLAGTILADKNGKKCNVTMKNQSANESRQNVPTVSFDLGDNRVGQYVLTLKDYYKGDYKLDGIRVYHPVGVNTDETALYTVTKDPNTNEVVDSELNARFVNLRALLADNLQDQVAAHEADVQEHADDPHYVEPELGTIAFFTDRDGVATISDYIKDGPKNEIYLDQGEAIGFSIMNYDQYTTGDNHGKVMVGLSVQGETAGQVTINNDTVNPQTVSSKTDMYYKINPTLDGTKGQVIIKNTGRVKIAITNLKVTGVLSLTPSITEIGAQALAVDDALSTAAVPEAFVEPSLSINRSLLSFAQNPYPAETTDDPGTTEPEPTHTPLYELVMQLISNFVKALFNSVARLFGN